jgi:hypothetical protein
MKSNNLRQTSVDHTAHLLKLADLEKNNTDHTLPGHNYLGPGTAIVSNLINQLKPRDVADKNALIHDTAYLLAQNMQDVIQSDKDFNNNNLTLDLESILASKMLALKNLFALESNYWTSTNIDEEDRLLIVQKLNSLLNK